MSQPDTVFNKPKDQKYGEFVGSKQTYRIKRGHFKGLMVKLSKAYAESKGNSESMNTVLDEFTRILKMDDPLATRNLRAKSTDVIEQLYAADPTIANASTITLGGRYLLRHRELV